jgi:hypothetical protein
LEVAVPVATADSSVSASSDFVEVEELVVDVDASPVSSEEDFELEELGELDEAEDDDAPELSDPDVPDDADAALLSSADATASVGSETESPHSAAAIPADAAPAASQRRTGRLSARRWRCRFASRFECSAATYLSPP